MIRQPALLKSFALPSSRGSRSKPSGHNGFIEFCNAFKSTSKKNSLLMMKDKKIMTSLLTQMMMLCEVADSLPWRLLPKGVCQVGQEALNMPIHQRKMDAEYTASMWGDAGVGVGVAAQRIMMKYFINCFGYKFTVDEVLITQLAVNLVPPVAGTVQYMDCTLNYWYKDLEGLLAGQIAKEHTNQPAFSCVSVDFVIGADHRQGSFRASV
jgi:hypothetical protein